ncbi:MAG TPA: trypsin-like peptidase domain-containing protein [Acidimicrobiales bacterium]|nr:trypsin-like peptidase domain-containing protein [Acidimicrobiales bacterium]
MSSAVRPRFLGRSVLAAAVTVAGLSALVWPAVNASGAAWPAGNASGAAWPAGNASGAASPGPPRAISSPQTVGPLFAGGAGGRHFCSASVVAAASRDLILTAAHCVSGTGEGLYFAPGYRDGTAPFGYWRVTAAYVDPAWLRSAAPQADFAFLRVVPVAPSQRRPVQEVVGGAALGAAPPTGARVDVTGYPAGFGGPVSCAATTYQRAGYPAFRCAGFSDGTSGGPWLSRSGHGPARAVGLIGGLEQGGCSPAVSYSPRLGAPAQALLARASAGGPSDVVPAAPGDGCAS